MSSTKELIDNAEEEFLVQQVITPWKTHLVTGTDSICAVACHPAMFHFHGANVFCTKRKKKRDNLIAKGNCGKRSRHGKLFKSRDRFTIQIPLLQD